MELEEILPAAPQADGLGVVGDSGGVAAHLVEAVGTQAVAPCCVGPQLDHAPISIYSGVGVVAMRVGRIAPRTAGTVEAVRVAAVEARVEGGGEEAEEAEAEEAYLLRSRRRAARALAWV